MADLTLNEYKKLNEDEIMIRLLEEYDNINHGKISIKPVIPVKTARDKGKRFRQFFIRYLNIKIPKKGIQLQGNQPF
ncbi:MAG: hypothetical protein GX654_09105 [Desulfatiglans sp.]|nr:hypothetical protein [Desulfatiglans sp.]